MDDTDLSMLLDDNWIELDKPLVNPKVDLVSYSGSESVVPSFANLRAGYGILRKCVKTVGADAVQGYLGEAMLQVYCTVTPNRFLEVVIAYPVELGVEDGLFPEQHMKALDRLKGIKRDLNLEGDDLVDEHAAKQHRREDDES
ncbi:hypothetical protein BGZ65_011164 [Modicella reniformis]|uniref:Uncharacterized protein n=1 Tax=Modicella reniformis TaxID=1440133 RepID=A0A9P6LSS9_9FUNG|nr:hypothetical protein BGZ65_011164 [Modicella reniformis]